MAAETRQATLRGRQAVTLRAADICRSCPASRRARRLPENAIVTAHLGGVTRASYDAIARALADDVERLRRSEPLRNRAV